METLNLEKDIIVHYVESSSFPDGVLEAHQKLHGLVEYNVHRKYFGISWMGANDSIIYKAAAEELVSGEFSKHLLPTFTVKQGSYIFIDVKDFMQNIEGIGDAFQTLLQEKNIDPQGACVEWYLEDESTCRCMIRTV
jgi:hypothetical protein